MSLTDSTKSKNYSNKTDKNIKVAEAKIIKFPIEIKVFGKAKDYPGAKEIIRRQKLKKLNKNKKK